MVLCWLAGTRGLYTLVQEAVGGSAWVMRCQGCLCALGTQGAPGRWAAGKDWAWSCCGCGGGIGVQWGVLVWVSQGWGVGDGMLDAGVGVAG